MSSPTIADLDTRLDRGATTCERLVAESIERALDPAGEGARVFVRLDRDAAIAAARISDQRRQAGQKRSPIDGLPISIKDLFDVAGETTTAGSIVLRDGIAAAGPARQDAPVVSRLRAAGAVIVGRTNMTEFAYSGLGLNPHYGTPRCVWDRRCDGGIGRVPGGSSSGAGVGVAEGLFVMGLGTDTGGSVRLPAAINGITGFKPTAARVPTEGALPLSHTLDSIGPLAPSVACCAVIDAILAGEPATVPEPAVLAHARFAVPRTPFLDGLDRQVAAAFDSALQTLRGAGAVAESMSLDEFAELEQAIAEGTFAAREAWEWHRGLLARAAERYDPRVRSRIERGARMSEAAYRRLFDVRGELQLRLADKLSGYDALLFPTLSCVPPRIAPLLTDDRAYAAANLKVLRNTTPINFLDGCGLSLPIHRRGDAPVGLTIGQLGGHDRRILALGLTIERALVPIRGDPSS